MEARILTRMDVRKFARKAYEMGVKYIGGCCGFEPYHVRAITEEVWPKTRGKILYEDENVNLLRVNHVSFPLVLITVACHSVSLLFTSLFYF